MMKIFFLLLATLLIGSGCAATHHSVQDLFDRSRAECRTWGCSKEFSVETQEASEANSNMLQLNGHVKLTGGAMVWWFEYGPDKDQLIYSTEPQILIGMGVKPVKTHLKKLKPMTPYYYRVVGFNEKQQKIEGAVYYEATVDPSCVGAGTLSAFAGPAMITGGLATGNPWLISGGVAVSSLAIFDEEVYGNGSNPKCKAVAGLVGGVGGYYGGKAYRDAHQPKQQPSNPPPSNPPPNNPPPAVPSVPPPGAGPGPAMPPRIP